jgi:DNA primase
MSLGPIKGASIHLREPGASDCLVVCEGPEDGLSLLAMLGLPVWVAAGAGNLAALEFPPGIRSIVIGADNDATGRREADKAAVANAARGLAVRILYPQAGFKDFNAEWQGAPWHRCLIPSRGWPWPKSPARPCPHHPQRLSPERKGPVVGR